MAYVGYEDLPAKVINNRLVPPLRKYYRANGTFDLYDIHNKQPICLHFLAQRNEASIYNSRLWNDYPFGTYIVNNSTNSTFNDMELFYQDNTLYGGYSRCAMRLKFNNVAGVFPYIIYMRNYSDHNGGSSYINAIKNNGSSVSLWGGGGNQNFTWSPAFGDATNMLDWKDYQYIDVCASSVDGSKYTGNWTRLRMSFIHRFTDDHPAYRYYR